MIKSCTVYHLKLFIYQNWVLCLCWIFEQSDRCKLYWSLKWESSSDENFKESIVWKREELQKLQAARDKLCCMNKGYEKGTIFSGGELNTLVRLKLQNERRHQTFGLFFYSCFLKQFLKTLGTSFHCFLEIFLNVFFFYVFWVFHNKKDRKLKMFFCFLIFKNRK